MNAGRCVFCQDGTPLVTRHPGSDFDLRVAPKLRDGHEAERRFAHLLVATGDTFEVKTEPKYEQTSNICVEFEQSDRRGGKKRSGIAATHAAWWAVEFLTDHWLILPTAELRKRARVEYQLAKDGHRVPGVRPMGDNGNRGVLLPLSAVIGPWMVTETERQAA